MLPLNAIDNPFARSTISTNRREQLGDNCLAAVERFAERFVFALLPMLNRLVRETQRAIKQQQAKSLRRRRLLDDDDEAPRSDDDQGSVR